MASLRPLHPELALRALLVPRPLGELIKFFVVFWDIFRPAVFSARHSNVVFRSAFEAVEFGADRADEG